MIRVRGFVGFMRRLPNRLANVERGLIDQSRRSDELKSELPRELSGLMILAERDHVAKLDLSIDAVRSDLQAELASVSLSARSYADAVSASAVAHVPEARLARLESDVGDLLDKVASLGKLIAELEARAAADADDHAAKQLA